MTSYLRSAARLAARSSIGKLPASPARLTGRLAKDGGTPVRDIRFRPWPATGENSLRTWITHASHAFRNVFVSGVEGLPQPAAIKFGAEWATFCGCQFALLLPHGTDALRIALAAALDHDGLEYGGEVIVPNLSFIASATAALDRRLGIALVDVDPDTLLLDPERVEEAIIPGRTRAIMAVHLFGQPCDMTALRRVADKYGLKVIEDAAQAHGAIAEDGPAGSLGDAAGFSFQSFKNLSCGEGGALTTNSEELFERAYAFHNAGRTLHGPRRWDHESLGWNCRPTEYQAVLLSSRLRSFPRRHERRVANFAKLHEHLRDVESVEPLVVREGIRCHGAHMFAMRFLNEHCGGISTDEFLAACQAEGAPIYRGYESTISDQPVMRRLSERRPEYVRVLSTPVAQDAARKLIYIPQNILLGTARDIFEIGAAVRKVAAHYSGVRSDSRPIRELAQ